MRMRGLSFLIVVGGVFFAACSREAPTKPEPAPVKPVEPTSISALTASATPSSAPVTNAPAPAPVLSASSAARAPAPIAGADLPRAKEYVQNLARGRKATAAKDYAHAVAFFDKALVAEPGDARALSERGYAYLLNDNLDAASKDLEAAAKRATSVDLLRQILFNQATVAEKRGDTSTADTLRARRDELGQAKRSKGKDCSISISRPGILPVKVATAREAWAELKKAHLARTNSMQLSLDEPVIADNATEETIRATLFGRAPEGNGVLAIRTSESGVDVGHVVIFRGKDIFIHGGLSLFMQGRCPCGDNLPRASDGDIPRIDMESEFLEMGYMCGDPKSNDIRPCEEVVDGTPLQSYCYRTETKFRSTFLDPKTLAIMLDIEETALAKGNMTFNAAQAQAVITAQPNAVLITGCGVDQRETIP